MLDEPVQEMKDIEVMLYPKDEIQVGTARPASVGAIIGIRPCIKLVVAYSHPDFDRLWAMVFSGHLKYAHLVFTKPHRGRSLVTFVSFSSEREE